MSVMNTQRRSRLSRPATDQQPSAKASAYSLTTHSRPELEKQSALWMGGSATLIMVESTTINCAVAMTGKARLREGWWPLRWPASARLWILFRNRFLRNRLTCT